MMIIPKKLKEVGCSDTSIYTMYRGEIIYIQDGKYYPTIINGYKDAAMYKSLKCAMMWIDDIKNKK